jgi:hypothetical protein
MSRKTKPRTDAAGTEGLINLIRSQRGGLDGVKLVLDLVCYGCHSETVWLLRAM